MPKPPLFPRFVAIDEMVLPADQAKRLRELLEEPADIVPMSPAQVVGPCALRPAWVVVLLMLSAVHSVLLAALLAGWI